MIRQAGLFGLSEHLERLSAIGDPLEQLGRVIDFEAFRPTLTAALAYGDERVIGKSCGTSQNIGAKARNAND